MIKWERSPKYLDLGVVTVGRMKPIPCILVEVSDGRAAFFGGYDGSVLSFLKWPTDNGYARIATVDDVLKYVDDYEILIKAAEGYESR